MTDLRARVDELAWYHTFDLPGGITTPGIFDHRKAVEKLLLPADLSGMRCLDAASSDGFFAFEMARRGGVEVVSVDLADTNRSDFQGAPGAGYAADAGRARAAFEVVRDATGLEVQRFDMSLYDVSPEALGRFDLVFVGNVLIHLRDPQAALHALRSVTDGELVSYEVISLVDTILHPLGAAGRLWDHTSGMARWWTPNLAGHQQLVEAAGFKVVERTGVLLQPFGMGQPKLPSRIPWRLHELNYWLLHRRLGVPSSCVRARPVG